MGGLEGGEVAGGVVLPAEGVQQGRRGLGGGGQVEGG